MLIDRTHPLSLPRWSEALPPLGGTFVQSDATFFVEECPAYLPSGEGEHLFVKIRKQNRTTQDVVTGWQRALSLHSNDIGTAGMKDRNATTTQWVSLKCVSEEQLAEHPLEGVEILEVSRHKNKLRTGHLHGNRFILHVPLLDEAAAQLPSEEAETLADEAFVRATNLCEQIAQEGFPNFYGPQRFGKKVDNHIEGRKLVLASRQKGRGLKRRFLVSSYQSALFNDVLAFRMSEGLLTTALAGDRMRKHANGASFLCEDPEAEQARLSALEISPTGLMPGYKVAMADGLPGEWEQALLDREELTPEDFRHLGKIATGTRRALSAPARDIKATREGTTLVLTFELPSGVYASSLLHEMGVLFVSGGQHKPLHTSGTPLGATP